MAAQRNPPGSGSPADGAHEQLRHPTQQHSRPNPVSPTEASDALNSFFNVFQDTLSAASSDNRHKAAWRGPNASHYSSELQLLKPHYAPFLWGVGSAAVSFLAFRIGGTVQFRRAAGGVGGGGFKLSKVGSSSSSTSGRRPTGMAAANDAEAKSQLAGRILSIPVDLSLSLLIGCSTTIFLTDVDKLRTDMSVIPLVEGRSLVSDDLCGDFTKEYKKRPQSFWDGWDGVNAEEQPSLNAIRAFVLNCKKREAHEKILRNEQGFGPDDPVAIPKPGVPSTAQPLGIEDGQDRDDSHGGD